MTANVEYNQIIRKTGAWVHMNFKCAYCWVNMPDSPHDPNTLPYFGADLNQHPNLIGKQGREADKAWQKVVWLAFKKHMKTNHPERIDHLNRCMAPCRAKI